MRNNLSLNLLLLLILPVSGFSQHPSSILAGQTTGPHVIYTDPEPDIPFPTTGASQGPLDLNHDGITDTRTVHDQWYSASSWYAYEGFRQCPGAQAAYYNDPYCSMINLTDTMNLNGLIDAGLSWTSAPVFIYNVDHYLGPDSCYASPQDTLGPVTLILPMRINGGPGGWAYGWIRLANGKVADYAIAYDTLFIGAEEPVSDQVSVNLSPSPAADGFTLSASSAPSAVEVFSADGRSFYLQVPATPEKRFTIPCRDWAPGVYYLRIHTDKAVSVRKILVAH